jgi:hypothetical protein
MENGLTKQQLQSKYHQDIMSKLQAIQKSFDEMIERTDQRLVSFNVEPIRYVDNK